MSKVTESVIMDHAPALSLREAVPLAQLRDHSASCTSMDYAL